MVGTASVLFAFAAGILLLRRLKGPLDERLMRGLRAWKSRWSCRGPNCTSAATRMRLKQVLRILIDNASRYSKAGTLIDLVSEAANERAVVRVVDRGMGIPESERGKVFERFFRGEAARPAAPAGSGLVLGQVDHRYARRRDCLVQSGE